MAETVRAARSLRAGRRGPEKSLSGQAQVATKELHELRSAIEMHKGQSYESIWNDTDSFDRTAGVRVRSWISRYPSAIAFAQTGNITVQVDKPGAAIPKTLFGLFFEDINFGADGGLYPERVKNRSFEFPNPMMGWKQLDRGDTKGTALRLRSRIDQRYAKLSLPAHQDRPAGQRLWRYERGLSRHRRRRKAPNTGSQSGRDGRWFAGGFACRS